MNPKPIVLEIISFLDTKTITTIQIEVSKSSALEFGGKSI